MSDVAMNDQEKFQVWLMEMGDILDRFIEKMPNQLKLDYSPESLLRIEDWMLAHYPDTDALLRETEKDKLDSLARYVGQVYRKNLDGKWTIRLDDPNYAFYGLPMIKFKVAVDPVVPHSEVLASADRRTGKYIYELFCDTKNMIKERK